MGDASSLFFSGIYHILYIYMSHACPVVYFKNGYASFQVPGFRCPKNSTILGSLIVIHTHWGKSVPCMFHVSYTRWWFQTFFVFTPIWGRFPF